MGWTVLYILFGIVALWLLGEVLLQYKARLRWRLLAFAGFAAVVVGVVAVSSIVVITLGAMAFAVGQTFVTLSYRRGFSTGWALGGKPGSSRRRRDGGDQPPPADADPVLEVSGLEAHDPQPHETPYDQQPYEDPAYDPAPYENAPYENAPYSTEPAYAGQYAGQAAPQPASAYDPQPLPDDTSEYGIYDRGGQQPAAPEAYPAYAQDQGYGYSQQEQHQYAPYSDPYIGYDPGQPAAAASYDGPGGYDGFGGYGGSVSYDPQGTIGQPAAYAPGPDAYPGDGYGSSYTAAEQGSPYGRQSPYDPYAGQGYGPQTPADGVWVPQQREAGPGAQPPPGQPYPYQDGYPPNGEGYGEQEGHRPQGYGYDASGNGYYYDDQRGY